MSARRGPALVTGASSGLGWAYADSLAARGHPLIVVARREERLRALARRAREAHGVETRVVVADLAAEEGLAACREALDASPVLDVAVLNAGFGSHGPVWEVERRRQADMVRVNCVAVVDLAAHLLPRMVARGAGAVVVVSSAAAWQPVPSMATYAATKAFGLHFAEALAEELRGTGVRALAVCPGPTTHRVRAGGRLGGSREPARPDGRGGHGGPGHVAGARPGPHPRAHRPGRPGQHAREPPAAPAAGGAGRGPGPPERHGPGRNPQRSLKGCGPPT